MRKEAVNTFTEGMVRDLNPINTPSNVLTDCLNGTLVTYDDNELSLQNDKGNYPLSNCRLNKGYVPVGIKEYNGILYIVSYNPIEDKVEIGSYPTPSYITTSNDKENTFTVDVITSGNTYEDFSENNKQTILIGSGGEKEWITYPGDEYKLWEIPPSIFPLYYEYTLVDTDHNVTDVTSLVETGEDFKKIPWKKAGWLAVTPKLPNLLDFNVNVGGLWIEDGNLKYSFNIQIESDRGKNIPYGINFVINNEQSSIKRNLQTLSLYNERTIYYININGEIPLNNQELFTFTFSPFITYNTIDYIYNSNIKTLSLNVNNIITASDIKLGESVFRYNIYKKATASSLGLIGFTISAANIDELAVMDGIYSLEYSISRRNWDTDGWIKVIDWALSTEFSGFGTTPIYVETSPFTQINEGINSCLFEEDLYKIDLRIKTEENQYTAEKSYTVYVSELVEGWNTNRYDQVDITDFIDRYPSTFEDGKNSVTLEGESFEMGELVPAESYKSWLAGSRLCGGKYSRAFTDTRINNVIGDSIDFQTNITLKGTPSITSTAHILAGPLWKPVLENSNTGMSINGIKQGSFDPYTGIITFSNANFSEETYNVVGKTGYSLSIINNLKQRLIPYTITPVNPTPSAYCKFDVTLLDAGKKGNNLAAEDYKLNIKLNTSGISGTNTPVFTLGDRQVFNRTLFSDSIKKLMKSFPVLYMEIRLNKIVDIDKNFWGNDRIAFMELGALDDSSSTVQSPYHARTATREGLGSASAYYLCFYNAVSDHFIWYNLTGNTYNKYESWINNIGKIIYDDVLPETYSFLVADIDKGLNSSTDISLDYTRKITFGNIFFNTAEGLVQSFDDINLSKLTYRKNYTIDTSSIAEYTASIIEKNSEAAEQFDVFTRDAFISADYERLNSSYIKMDTLVEDAALDTIISSLNGNTDHEEGNLVVNGQVVIPGRDNNNIGVAFFGSLLTI